MSWLVVRWPESEYSYPWHEQRIDDSEERAYIRKEGGEVVYAGIESEITAEKIVQRLDNVEFVRVQREENE